jgi:hypothetical protein
MLFLSRSDIACDILVTWFDTRPGHYLKVT